MSFWKTLLKAGLNVGGNAIMPGIGNLGSGMVDAIAPEEEANTQIDPAAAKKPDLTETLLSVGLGAAGGLAYDLLKPQKKVNQMQMRSIQNNQNWAKGG